VSLVSSWLEEVTAVQKVNVPQLVMTLHGLHRRMVEQAKKSRGRKKTVVGCEPQDLHEVIMYYCPVKQIHDSRGFMEGLCRVVTVLSAFFEEESLTTGGETWLMRAA
jgi:hypothetical protein